MRLEPFAKAVALLLWADEKVTPEEMILAKSLFTKYGISWDTAQPALENCLEDLLTPDDETLAADEAGEFVESDETLEIGCLDFGDDVDFSEILQDLCEFIVLDKVVDYKEIELIHLIAEACNLSKVLATAALLRAVKNSDAKLNFA